MIKTKVCNQCQIEKPVTDFYKAKTKDGVMARCIVCYKQRDLDKSARVAIDDPCGDVIEENKLSKRENDMIKEFLANRKVTQITV